MKTRLLVLSVIVASLVPRATAAGETVFPGVDAAPGRLAQACVWKPEPALVTGALRQWQPVTLSFRGPDTAEDASPNPSTDFRLVATFRHGRRSVAVRGYYAADGNAAESGADRGGVWRVHFLPDKEGVWKYKISFRTGPGLAIKTGSERGEPTGFDGVRGSFEVGPADPNAPGFYARGLLRYTGERYLRFAETGEPFLKGGADSPENLLAFADFDATTPTHRYEPHARDWRPGDPAWRGDKGKNLVGALNYLAGKGMNSVYFLTMNVGGDGKDVWPWTADTERQRFDCSKLDQWELVFRHMDRLGLALHVVTQETENDRLLDGGELGPERMLYYRELVARFAHHPALVWNLGEENTNTDAQRKAFAYYIRALDPYDHPIVVHTYTDEHEKVYAPLLGFEMLDGPSLQLAKMELTYEATRKWVAKSAEAGRPWFVCLDEFGPASAGAKPDADDPAHDGVRRHGLWGNLMAGGAGCEWLFGYEFAHNDINCEDWRSRDGLWDQTRHALDFFRRIPYPEMQPVDGAVDGEGAWCLAKPGEVYAVYAPAATGLRLDLPEGRYRVQWYNPREGGPLQDGRQLHGGGRTELGAPPADPDKDWVALLRNSRNEHE